MSLFNPSGIARILSSILLIESAFLLACVPVSVIYAEPVLPFLQSAFIVLITAGLLRLPGRRSTRETLSKRDAFLIVAPAWVLISLGGTLPYLFSGSIPGIVNAFFESVSGFTTTGATILTEVERLPHSLLFWRSLTHWIGGVGIIVLVILVLPSLRITGYQLFTLESSVKEKINPRIRGVVTRILLIYLSLTAAEILMLLPGDMKLFDIICHSFATVATGGFSTRNTSLAGYSPYTQYVVGIFMLLAAVSYVVYFNLFTGRFRKIRKNGELWFYLFMVAASVFFLTAILYSGTDRSLELSFRDAFFQVTSQVSTTGFASSDYMKFPATGWFFLFLLMFAGGSTGSTSGGIKMGRHLIALKNLRLTFIRLHHPSAVIPLQINGQKMTDDTVNQVMAFILLYLFTFVAGTLLMQVSGIPLLEASGATATSMAGIGPGLGLSGNMGNFAHFNPMAKIMMILLMIAGRLELYTVITVFTRPFWRN